MSSLWLHSPSQLSMPQEVSDKPLIFADFFHFEFLITGCQAGGRPHRETERFWECAILFQPVNSKAFIAAFPAHNKGTSKSGILPPIKLPINDTNNDCDHFKLFLSILGL